MFKMFAIVVSLLNPSDYALMSSSFTFDTMEACQAALEEQQVQVKNHFDKLVEGGVEVEIECVPVNPEQKT